MSFTDDLKRSLGFDETDEKREGPGVIDSIRDAVKPIVDNLGQQINKQQTSVKNQHQYRNNQQQTYAPNPQQYDQVPKPAQKPVPRPQPKQEPVYDEYEVIIPEQSFYEIVLIRPKSLDDINYVVDQVIEAQNPVILDLSFLEKESPANFKLAGDKIKQMREKYGVQAVLLARSEDKDLIIVSPKKVKVLNKG